LGPQERAFQDRIRRRPPYQTSIRGIYAIGGAISPAYIEIEEQGSFKERKHSNLIFTAVRDAVEAMEHIAASPA
jgi:hypothetical protein